MINFTKVVMIYFYLLTVCTLCYAQTSEEYYDKGLMYGTIGKFAEAKEQFTKALELDPYDYGAYSALEIIEDMFNGKISKDVTLLIFKGVDYSSKQPPPKAVAFSNL